MPRKKREAVARIVQIIEIVGKRSEVDRTVAATTVVAHQCGASCVVRTVELSDPQPAVEDLV